MKADWAWVIELVASSDTMSTTSSTKLAGKSLSVSETNWRASRTDVKEAENPRSALTQHHWL